MAFKDTFSLALRTVRGNKLRTGITVSIIAFGIMALIGISTAIEAVKQKFTESFSSMGANGFTIRYKQPNRNFGGRGGMEMRKEKKGQKREKKSNLNKPVTRLQAEMFKENYDYPAEVAISLWGVRDAIVSYRSKKTNPTVRVLGGDENFIDQNGYEVMYGRNFSELDLKTARNVCIIGKDVAVKFFGENLERPVEKIIKVNSIPFRVIGTLKPKGKTFGMSLDNIVITSYNNVRRYFNTGGNASFNIQVKVKDLPLIEGAMSQASGIFRPIRGLTTMEEDNFVIEKSDSFASMLINNLAFISGAALVIGIITLIGSAVGLMNIMLVAVTERTKEIGLIKAIGGKKKEVRDQFLNEAVIISIMGAIIGIILGILIGNIASWLLDTSFVIPWAWIVSGVIICSLTGLLAGLYPARKASRLNPIEALRYE